MALNFKILRGNKNNLIDEEGNSKLPEEKLVNGYWYLTNDTAEVYVCLEIDGLLKLKKINECNINSDFDFESFDNRLTALENAHNEENVESFGYRSGFPKVGVLNRLYIANDEKRTYIYTNNGYLPIADQFDTIDHDENADTPEVRIIFGGTAD